MACINTEVPLRSGAPIDWRVWCTGHCCDWYAADGQYIGLTIPISDHFPSINAG